MQPAFPDDPSTRAHTDDAGRLAGEHRPTIRRSASPGSGRCRPHQRSFAASAVMPQRAGGAQTQPITLLYKKAMYIRSGEAIPSIHPTILLGRVIPTVQTVRVINVIQARPTVQIYRAVHIRPTVRIFRSVH